MKNDYLNNQAQSQKYLPLFDIALDNVVPPSLHIFLGVAQDAFKKIIKSVTAAADGEIIAENIFRILEDHGISRLAWFQTFTGI